MKNMEFSEVCGEDSYNMRKHEGTEIYCGRS